MAALTGSSPRTASVPGARRRVAAAVVGALPDVAGRSAGSLRRRLTTTLAPLGWLGLGLGLVPVAAAYGFLAVLIGSRLPQLSTGTVGDGLPVRLLAGISLLVLGALLVFYGDVRLPAMFGYGWFPAMPWNS